MTGRTLTSVRIVRTCPRCNKRSYMLFWIAKGTASCNEVGCGHVWYPRLKKDEDPRADGGGGQVNG